MMPKRSESGFVLVATLWILATLAIFSGFIASWVGSAVADAERRWQQFDQQLQASAMRQRLEFLVLTQHYTAAGLTTPSSAVDQDSDTELRSITPVGDEWPLDGRPFVLKNGWTVAMLDEGAKFAINFTTRKQLRYFLRGLGVAEQDHLRLYAQLKDYTDADDRPSASGAEATQYRALGLPPPVNRPLISPLEIFRIPAWSKWRAHLLARGWRDRVTVHTPFVNVNTVLPDVVQARWQLDNVVAQRLLRVRQIHPITSTTGLTRSAPNTGICLCQRLWMYQKSSLSVILLV